MPLSYWLMYLDVWALLPGQAPTVTNVLIKALYQCISASAALLADRTVFV